jgi:hypothetical protein
MFWVVCQFDFQINVFSFYTEYAKGFGDSVAASDGKGPARWFFDVLDSRARSDNELLFWSRSSTRL